MPGTSIKDPTKEPTIRKEYNPDDTQVEILRRVYKRYYAMRDKRKEYEAVWDQAIKNWEAHREAKIDWKSNLFVPLTTSVIEAQLSEIINQDLIPWAIPRGSEDEARATVMNAILQYTWDVAKSDVAMFDIIKDALIFGTGIGQEYYWKQPRVIRGKKTSKGDYELHNVFEYDNSYLEPVKLEDFFVDERARGFSGPFQANDCVRRFIMDISDFRTFFQGKEWDPLGNAKFVKPGGDTNYYEWYKPPERLDHSHEVEVLWYWSRVPDELSIIANDVVVKTGPNPYRHKQLPFIRVIDVKRPYHFYGKGESELMDSLQEEVNTSRRMIIDRNHLDIDKAFIVSDTFTMEDEDNSVEPHKFITAGSDAKPLEYGDIPASVFKSQEMLRDDVIRVTGMDERQQSVSSAGTATEAAILKEATLKRLGLKIWQIRNDTLVDVGRLRCANIMQFYAQPRLEKILGEDAVRKAKASGTLVKQDGQNYQRKYRSIRMENQKLQLNAGSPEIVPARGFSFFEAMPDLFMPSYGGYDIRYKATSQLPISKPLEMQKATELYDRLIQNQTMDPYALASYVLKTHEQDPDKFKKQLPVAQQSGIDVQKMVDLASVENGEMVNGKPIGPTPYASPVHTELHIAYMKSKKFKEDVPPELTDKIIQIFTNHITGELFAQKMRGETGGVQQAPQSGQPGYSQPAVPSQGEAMGAMMPGMVQGGGDVPSGMDGANSGVQVGRAT